jgi:HPt (histidine-containing phosphotransfer) domain-containing protein
MNFDYMTGKKSYSIEKLKEYVGDNPTQIREMITLFLDTVPDEIVCMQKLADEKEWVEVYKLAHRIKPSFEVFSMDSILDNIKKIEHLARENNVENSLVEYIKKLSIELKEIEELLRSELSER